MTSTAGGQLEEQFCENGLHHITTKMKTAQNIST